MLVLAFGISFALASSKAKKENINPGLLFNFFFAVFISGIIGARVFYVIKDISYYLKEPLEIIMLQRGGLSWFGGLISGFIFGIAYLKKTNAPIYKTLDLVVPFAALAQAIGRFGCFLNGCCFGRTAIPVQLYSSLVLIFIFIILRLLQERAHKEGQIFLSYLLLYSAKRFFIEFLRLDNEIILFGLTLFQFISIAIFCVAFIKLILLKRSNV